MVTRAKPKAGQNRVGMMVRIAPDIRERLEQAAEKAGRSLGQEVELRLDRSFELVSMIEVMAKSNAELASKIVEDYCSRVEQSMLQLGGGDDLFLACGMLGIIVKTVESETGKSIREDEFTRNKAEREVLGYIPTMFRRLPERYSDMKAKGASGRLNPEVPKNILPGQLAPLGWVGPWPPEE